MKLVVFAHTPPPHHGQSYMVQLMVSGFGGDRRERRHGVEAAPASGGQALGIECYHVNARLSDTLEDIGEFQPKKFLLLFIYCLQAVWCRIRYGAPTLYYVPAPGKRAALFRDFMVMALCRPFFRRVILHWHAAGMGKWLETEVQSKMRENSYRFLGGVDLSIVLSNFNRADALKLLPKSVRIVGNGIPDPCPDFTSRLRPRRSARVAARRKLLRGEPLADAEQQAAGGDASVFQVLYLAHCTADKGIFDALQGVLLAREKLAAAGSSVRLRFQIAGGFVNPQERVEFDRICASPVARGTVEYLGFVSGDQKREALERADLFLFPTWFANENQPVNLIEAMAFGLPVLTTRWRSVPEVLPPDFHSLVDIHSPAQIAGMLIDRMGEDSSAGMRRHFVENYSILSHLESLAAAFRSVEATGLPAPAIQPAAGGRT